MKVFFDPSYTLIFYIELFRVVDPLSLYCCWKSIKLSRPPLFFCFRRGREFCRAIAADCVRELFSISYCSTDVVLLYALDIICSWHFSISFYSSLIRRFFSILDLARASLSDTDAFYFFVNASHFF